ncbi:MULTISPECIES: hypothetical protein [unclassified Thioalkalivibrio]|uniref:hypothetical protein n=1 Tax=unclassified Thioalkalivibrio TaxID=2621013 RepID=UPI00035F50ED|nr:MULTISPECIES: hypothetical protein [unclassified Thioalkalivibrio]
MLNVVVWIYVLAVPLWIGIWWSATGFRLMRHNRLLALPFLLSLVYVIGNALLVAVFGGLSEATYEEGRYVFITDRAMIAVQATASVLIVATIVYGLSIRRVPVHFIRFMVYAFVALLGVMAPILWIPAQEAEFFFVLRHVQSIGLNFGLFLCVAGIVVLLQDLLRHGDAEVSLLGGMHDVPRSGNASADRHHDKS